VGAGGGVQCWLQGTMHTHYVCLVCVLRQAAERVIERCDKMGYPYKQFNKLSQRYEYAHLTIEMLQTYNQSRSLTSEGVLDIDQAITQSIRQ
jgi:hypothetical protein